MISSLGNQHTLATGEEGQHLLARLMHVWPCEAAIEVEGATGKPVVNHKELPQIRLLLLQVCEDRGESLPEHDAARIDMEKRRHRERHLSPGIVQAVGGGGRHPFQSASLWHPVSHIERGGCAT